MSPIFKTMLDLTSRMLKPKVKFHFSRHVPIERLEEKLFKSFKTFAVTEFGDLLQ